MANLSIIYQFINILPNRVDDIYLKLKIKKYNKSTAIIKKTLFVDVISKFALIKGSFIKKTDNLTPSRKLTKSYLTKYVQGLYNWVIPHQLVQNF